MKNLIGKILLIEELLVGKSECLIMRSPNIYEELDIDSMKHLIKLLKNSIKHQKVVNNYSEQKNKEYYDSISCVALRSNPKIIIKKDHLYLIHDETFDTLKIGRSSNPKSRLAQLQCATSNSLNILYVIKECGCYEKDIHKKYKDLRLASEWFINDGSIVDFFKSGLMPF
jgi:hypothetical protein